MIIEPLEHLGAAHILNTSVHSADDIGRSELVLLTNCTSLLSVTNDNNAYVFVVDPNAIAKNVTISGFTSSGTTHLNGVYKPNSTGYGYTQISPTTRGRIEFESDGQVSETEIGYKYNIVQTNPGPPATSPDIVATWTVTANIGDPQLLFYNSANNYIASGSFTGSFTTLTFVDGTGENRLIHKYPLGHRNSMIIRKRPTDRLCASSASVSSGSGNIQVNLNVDVRANPISFQDTQNQIDPTTFGVRGETTSSDQTIVGMSGLSEFDHHGNVLCGPSRALDVQKANLVLVTNVTGQKMALTMLDENDVQIGQIMIPRYGQVKVRKNTTDKLFGSVSITGPAYGNYTTVRPGLTFMPIGFTN